MSDDLTRVKMLIHPIDVSDEMIETLLAHYRKKFATRDVAYITAAHIERVYEGPAFKKLVGRGDGRL